MARGSDRIAGEDRRREKALAWEIIFGTIRFLVAIGLPGYTIQETGHLFKYLMRFEVSSDGSSNLISTEYSKKGYPS